MSVAIKRRSELEIRPPQFVCDDCIHSQIKPPLPNTAFAMIVIGSPGSGKTSIMVNMLSRRDMYKKAFDAVHIVMNSHSRSSLKNNIFKGHKRIYEHLDLNTLTEIVDESKSIADDKGNSLLVIDDETAALKDKELQRTLKDLIFNRRHYRTSLLMLVQNWMSVPLDVRKHFSHFITFKPRNTKEADAIFEEMMQVPKKTGDNIRHFVFKDSHTDAGKHTFLMGDTTTGSFYRNFDELELPDN